MPDTPEDDSLRTWIERNKPPSISANRRVCYLNHHGRNIASHSDVAKPPQRSEAARHRGELLGKSEWPDGMESDGKYKCVPNPHETTQITTGND